MQVQNFKFNPVKNYLSVAMLGILAVGTEQSLAADDGSAFTLEEVIVTARRKQEDLQTVPLSVVAFSADSLEKRSISSLGDLGQVVPNLTVGTGVAFGGSIASIFIRGIGQDRGASTAESGVGTYVDGIFLGQSDGGLIDLLDVERIEVLRGPQGTLFGKNSIGGAINFVSKKPASEKEGKIEFTVGKFDRLDVEGMVNIALSDNVFARVSALSKSRDGYVKDVYDPNATVDLGDVNSRAIRGQLLWEANSDLQVNFSYDWISTSTNGTPFNIVAVNPDAPRLPGSDEPLPTLTGDHFVTQLSADTFSEFEGYGLGMVIDWKIGDLSLKSLTSYRTFDNEFMVDVDGSAAVLRDELVTRDHEQYSQEFHLKGDAFSGNMDYIVGVFLFNKNPTDTRAQQRNTLGGLNSLYFDEETDSYALFGEGTIHLLDDFDITLGIRQTWEEKEIVASRNGTVGQQKEKWSPTTYRFSGNYQWTEDFMTYASFATGFKSGGFNDRTPNPALPFEGLMPYDEEVAATYEVGFKSDILGGRARLNGAVFHTDYTDLQLISLVNGSSNVSNVGEAEIDGIELDLTLLVTEKLQLDASAAWLDARVTDDQGNTTISNGAQLAKSPEYAYTIGLEYLFDQLPTEGTLSARLDWGWKDDYRMVGAENISVSQEAHGLLNTRLTYRSTSGNYMLALYGTNITDKEYIISGADLRNTPFANTVVEIGRPREWGISLKTEF